MSKLNGFLPGLRLRIELSHHSMSKLNGFLPGLLSLENSLVICSLQPPSALQQKQEKVLLTAASHVSQFSLIAAAVRHFRFTGA